MNDKDKLLCIQRFLDFLLLKYPMKTGLGTILGLGISVIAKIFSPVLNNIKEIDATVLMNWYCGAILGLLIIYAKSIRLSFQNKRLPFPEHIEEKVIMTETKHEKGIFSEAEKRSDWREVHQYVYEYTKKQSLNSAARHNEPTHAAIVLKSFDED